MLTAHISWFEEHVRGFLTGDAEDDSHIELKKRHSLNVLAEARAITSALDIAPRLAEAAHLAALFHDAGRFPQYRDFKTFRDGLSTNHALLGVRSLRAGGVLAPLDPDLRVLVLGAVAMHNRRAVPGRLSAGLDTVTRIVRDSDKLDIVNIMLEHLRPGGKRSDVVVLHMADEPDRYSGEIVAQIRAGRIGDYSLMRYENDFKLLLLSWVFDLNFAPSRRAFLERGHVKELFGLLPSTPELTQLEDSIYDVLNR
ncbi:HD domain-containing protein [Fundidesulfovibrio terrae]|uniref:HD domain-containing protein n=1 Tax=Fundidesulfovibrio terrae TaxID=2922866 RepID=UPI001FAF704B|nr:HD domain-containing protein [Fundidesulfovibrio terrae]